MILLTNTGLLFCLTHNSTPLIMIFDSMTGRRSRTSLCLTLEMLKRIIHQKFDQHEIHFGKENGFPCSSANC